MWVRVWHTIIALFLLRFDITTLPKVGFPAGSDCKESACQSRRPRFHPWVGMISWRRKWQPTPVFLPEEFHGQRSLAGYSPWGHKESDTTEWLTIDYKSTDVRNKCLFSFSTRGGRSREGRNQVGLQEVTLTVRLSPHSTRSFPLSWINMYDSSCLMIL